MNDQPRACPTARAMIAAMEGGSATAESLVESCLAVIAAREPVVGAWMVVDAEAALSRARALDQARRLGDKVPPLAGVPAPPCGACSCTRASTTRSCPA